MSEPDGAKTQRVRIDIAYDGTHFAGWASQPGLRTVQSVLESALGTVLRRESSPRLTVAGRTDAGVHALGQVAHFDLSKRELAALTRANAAGVPRDPAATLKRRMNSILGEDSDVLLQAVTLVSTAFDARFSATWRSYRYRIADPASLPNPLRRWDTVTVSMPLDVAAMQAAAETVLGLHDFATFCKARPDATTIRELLAFDWSRDADGVLNGWVRADAFCHSMVRALVGGCVAAGAAKFAPEHLGELRVAAARSSEFKVMPAHGLTLMEVGYPAEHDWAERAERIRAKRSIDE